MPYQRLNYNAVQWQLTRNVDLPLHLLAGVVHSQPWKAAQRH